MKRTVLLLILLFSSTYILICQNYNNIVNYHFNNTPKYGVKIRTNLPFVNSSQMPVINITGYNYNSTIDATATLSLQISWYIYNNAFYVPTMSSAGGTAPIVWLSNENGKVVIFLDQKIYFQRFTVSAFAQGMSEKPEYFAGWTVSDEALTGSGQVKVPYKNVFGDKVGIGTETPQYTLDVNGTIGAKGIFLNTTSYATSGWATSDFMYNGHTLRISAPQGRNAHNVIGFYPGTYDGNDTRFTMLEMYISNSLTNYTKKVQIHSSGDTYFNGGNVGIGTDNPKNKLEVAGTIRATEVKVEAMPWADFVFDKEYKLRSLEELENHINKHKHLPDIPSEVEVNENGVSLGEMQAKLLQKIEELTLYVIELKKENIEIKKQLNSQTITNEYTK